MTSTRMQNRALAAGSATITSVATLTFEQARACVLEQVVLAGAGRQIETVPLDEALGRVLAYDLQADRDYPPLPRSARDGFAVRAADLPGNLTIIGEIAAGSHLDRALLPGEAVEIMTGAPLPPGADAVVMVEHTQASGGTVTAPAIESGANFTERGSEARAGEVLLPAGSRIGYTEIGLLATVGSASVAVNRRPRVAILATGDELVGVAEHPAPFQIRNSNAHALAAQVRRAGGLPEILPIARDQVENTAPLIERGLRSDLLLLSGGVSAGKYDIVETVLAGMGAEFYFDRVKIQPGQPLVFGRARGTWFFGLPGNPASTMLTFELFARAALGRIAGEVDVSLPLTEARLTERFRQRPGLTRFLPARLSPESPEVTPVRWSGSGDVAALCRANAYLVTDPDREQWEAGELIRVLVKS
jgi:molybdopterin molybdotransferase